MRSTQRRVLESATTKLERCGDYLEKDP